VCGPANDLCGLATLRPFTPEDIPWVYEVSVDPAMQHFVQMPSPCRLEHAAFFVEQMAIVDWES